MGNSHTIKSGRKQFEILATLINQGQAGVSELADHTGLPKSTVHIHLQTLAEVGAVTKDGSRYRPTLLVFSMGEAIRNELAVYRYGRGEIDRLAVETGELVNLALLDEGQARVIYLEHGHQPDDPATEVPVSTEFTAAGETVDPFGEKFHHSLGGALAMHATAMGKAILANLSKTRVREIIDEQGLPKFTENTITSEVELFEELETIRSMGYAEDDEELAEGIRCVGAAIEPDDEPMAAVSITVPAEQLDGEYKAALARQIINTANMIKVKRRHQSRSGARVIESQ